MSGNAPAVAPAQVDAFAAAFQAGQIPVVPIAAVPVPAVPNKALEDAKKAAERSMAAVTKAAALAGQLAAKQPPAPAPAAAAPPAKPNPLLVVQQIAAHLVQQHAAAEAKPDPVAAYKKVTEDADRALKTITAAVDAARAALATAEKTRMDALGAGEAGDAARAARFGELAADAGGRQIIDGMVAAIGSKASGPANKKFVADALRKRFDVELTGDLSTKALPQIYKLLAKVPESHTTFNDGLEKINREQGTMPGTSDYGGKTINLRCGRAGAAGAVMPNFLKNVDGIGMVNHFNHTTLHEVGHSVNGKFPSDQYAGWAGVSHEQLRTIILDTKAFRAVEGYPRDFLEKYVGELLAKRDPAKSDKLKQIFADAKTMAAAPPTAQELIADPGVAEILRIRAMPDRARGAAMRELRDKATLSQLPANKQRIGTLVCQALLADPTLTPQAAAARVLSELAPAAGILPARPDWSALSKHAAVEWFKAVSLKGESKGLWGSDGDTRKNAIGGQVIQECYPNDWQSYNIAARADRVSNYQFRAGPEWFAELYGVYYGGKLPQNHRHYAWFKDVIDK